MEVFSASHSWSRAEERDGSVRIIKRGECERREGERVERLSEGRFYQPSYEKSRFFFIQRQIFIFYFLFFIIHL